MVYTLSFSHFSLLCLAALSQMQLSLYARGWLTLSQATGRGSSWIYFTVSIHWQKKSGDGQGRLGTVSVLIQPFICACSIHSAQSKGNPALLNDYHHTENPHLKEQMEKKRRYLCLQQTQWCQCLCVRMESHQNRQLTGEKIANKILDCSHFIWPKWREESLIRMRWEIIVSLWAIGPFHVYVMHMHGLEQSSETRYQNPHSVTEFNFFFLLSNTFVDLRHLHWKVIAKASDRHVCNIWLMTSWNIYKV